MLNTSSLCFSDIDECERKLHECVNKEENYSCVCLKGYQGEGRKGGEGCIPNTFPMIELALGKYLTDTLFLHISYEKQRSLGCWM